VGVAADLGEEVEEVTGYAGAGEAASVEERIPVVQVVALGSAGLLHVSSSGSIPTPTPGRGEGGI
jgi:hypothetical protein